MKKLCKKLTSLVLVLSMLLSLSFWVTAASNLPTYTYTNTDAATLKVMLNNYIDTEQESAIFYSQSCKLSTGEEGFCYIGYDKEAKAFYIMLIDNVANPSFNWCYKYDTDYVWKYYGSSSYSRIWVEIDHFGIEFIGRTYNWGNNLELSELSEECQFLFRENNDIFSSYVNYTYQFRTADELNDFAFDSYTGDVIYAYAKYDFESEPFYSRIRCNQGDIYIERLINGEFETCYKYSEFDRTWTSSTDGTTVDEINVRFNKVQSLVDSEAFDSILVYLNKPYYPVSNDRLNYKRTDDYIAGGRTYQYICHTRIELSTGERGFAIIGWSAETQCFYIQMRTSENPDGKWSYKFGNFNGRVGWMYQDVTTDNDFSNIYEFSIRFYDESTGQYLKCPSELSFMFTDGDCCKVHTNWDSSRGICITCGYECSHSFVNDKSTYTASCSTCEFTKTWYPFAEELVEQGLVDIEDIKHTDDGFFMLTKSLSEIFKSADIYYLYENSEGTKVRSVDAYYDDWYIYGIETENGCEYSLLKMREQENDMYDINGDKQADNDNPGVTISFVGLNYSKLLSLFNLNTISKSYDLTLHLDELTGPSDRDINNETVDYNTTIVNYFSSVKSKGAYLVAEEYIQFIVRTSSVNGVIFASNPYLSLLNNIAVMEEDYYDPYDANDKSVLWANLQKAYRVPDAILEYNQKAGYNIYNAESNTIHISNVNVLTDHEKHIILALHTANTTFNSFAAEVVYHAQAVTSWNGLHTEDFLDGFCYYKSAIRADMGLGEENESGLADEYYNLDSDIVKAQAQEHGEY